MQHLRQYFSTNQIAVFSGGIVKGNNMLTKNIGHVVMWIECVSKVIHFLSNVYQVYQSDTHFSYIVVRHYENCTAPPPRQYYF